MGGGFHFNEKTLIQFFKILLLEEPIHRSLRVLINFIKIDKTLLLDKRLINKKQDLYRVYI